MAEQIVRRLVIQGAESALNDLVRLENQYKKNREEITRLRKAGQEGSQGYKVLRGEQEKLRVSLQGVKKEVRQQSQEIVNSAKKLPKDSIAGLELRYNKLRQQVRGLSADARKSKAGQQLAKQARIARQEITKANASIGQMRVANAQNQKALAGSARSLASAFGLGSALFVGVGLLKDAARAVEEFNTNLNKLQSITGLAGEELEILSERANDISKNFGTAAADVLDGFALVGSALPQLLKFPDTLADVTEQAEILSKAAGTTLAESVDAVAKTLNQFQLEASKTAEVVDIFATAQQLGTARVTELSEAIKVVGSTANAANVSFEETTVLLQTLAKGGITGAEGGTKLRNILIKLAKTGRNDLNPALRDWEDILQTLSEEITDLPKAVELFDARNAGAALTLINLRDTVSDLNGNLNDTGNALEQATINTDNLTTRVDKLRAAWQGWIRDIDEGEGVFSTFIATVLEGLTNVFESAGTFGTEEGLLAQFFGLGPLSFLIEGAANRFDERKAAEQVEQINAALEDAALTQENLLGLTESTAEEAQLTAQATEDQVSLEEQIQKILGQTVASDKEKRRLKKEQLELQKKLREEIEREFELLEESQDAREKLLEDRIKAFDKKLTQRVIRQLALEAAGLAGPEDPFATFGDPRGRGETPDLGPLGEEEGDDTLFGRERDALQAFKEEEISFVQFEQELYQARLQNQLDFLNASIAAVDENTEEEADLIQQRAETQAALVESMVAEQAALAGQFGEVIGGVVGDVLIGAEDTFENFSRGILDIIFKLLEKQVLAAVTEATVKSFTQGDSVATFGVTGAIRAAILGALIKGAFSAVRSRLQSFDEGGMVDHPDGGRIMMPQNMPTREGGDNVLITAKRGEVILNENQQSGLKMLAGSDVFRRLRVPGFNDGGIVGTIPQVSPLGQGLQIDNIDARFGDSQIVQLASTLSRAIVSGLNRRFREDERLNRAEQDALY